MHKFTLLSCIISSVFILFSCNNTINENLKNVSAKSSATTENKLTNIEKKKTNPFYFDIPYDPKAFSIQVVFEDESGVRINKENNRLVIENNDTAKKLNEILIRNKVVGATDLTYSGMPEEKIIEDKKILEKAYGEGFPSRYSVQSYTFSRNELKDVVEEIKKLPHIISVCTVGYLST